MKKILRTRIVTRTSRRMIVCRENFSTAGENLEQAATLCPNCGTSLGALPTPAASAQSSGADVVLLNVSLDEIKRKESQDAHEINEFGEK